MSNLTQEQFAKLKKKLQHRYLELQGEIRDELGRSSDERYISLASSLKDVGDNSFVDMLVDLDASIIDRQVREMHNVETSLTNLAELNFGDCIDCNEEIGFDRLMASPTAQRCLDCQNRHEKTYAHELNPNL
jgi:RNA polymerase-binding protein DksA